MKRMRAVIIASLSGVALAAGAAAAWTIFSPQSNGSAAGAFATTTTQNQITFSSGSGTPVDVVPCTTGSGTTCTGGSPGTIPVAITNNDPSNAHAASGLTISLSSTATGCAAHLFVTGSSNLTESVPAGMTLQNGSVTYVADPSTPASCSGAAITAFISGSAS